MGWNFGGHLKDKVDVIICTPGRMMEAEYVQSLTETIQVLNKNNISWVFSNQYSSLVNSAREATIMGSKYLNASATEPMNGEYEYQKIIWIDSDISWTPEDFIKLYESPLDIVSGIYFNEEGVPMISFKEDSVYFDHKFFQEKKYPFEVFGIGFGFVAMKQGVFESIPRPWFDSEFQRISKPDGEDIFVAFGEDFSWCKKAEKAGLKIYADPSIRVTHHKKMGLRA